MVRVIEKQAKELTLEEIICREVNLYAGISDTDFLYPILDNTHKTYAVVLVPGNPDDRPAWVVVLARVVDDYVIIDEDGPSDKPLVEALMVNGGIPREKIILAYKGEKLPTPE